MYMIIHVYRCTCIHIHTYIHTWGAMMSGSKYKPVPLTTLPVPSTQLSMTYLWRETQKAQVEGLSIRAKLKESICLSTMALNTKCTIQTLSWLIGLMQDQQMFILISEPLPRIYSFLGAVLVFGPLIFWYYVFKTDSDRKDRKTGLNI